MIHHSTVDPPSPCAMCRTTRRSTPPGPAAMHHFDEYGNEFASRTKPVEPVKSVKTAR